MAETTNVRFVGVPRSVINETVAAQPGWRHLGERMLSAAKADCPVSKSDDHPGGALRDSLEVRFISGADPRILVGSKTLGDILGYVLNGTDPHDIDPVNASALRFTSGGTVVFAQHVDHPGTAANPFLLKACQKVAHDGISAVA